MKKAIFFLCLSVLLFSNSAIAQNLPSYLPPNGLVGWWPFNGNANDESGNGNHGTVNGATLASDRNGNAAHAYFFNGISDFISLSSDNLPDQITDRTVSCFFKKNNNSSPWTHTIVSYGIPSNSNATMLGVSNSNNIVVQGWADDFGTSYQTSNEWEHFVFSMQNGIGKIYLNGQLISMQSLLSWNTILGYFIIGCRVDLANSYFFGSIDDIAIYNRALTQEEITALYTGTPVNGGGGNTSANPVPPGIPYQAVVRNANGQVAANAAVTMRFTLHQTTADGAVEYQETHVLTTNAQGLMSTVLGQGTAVQNTFAAINWANTTKFLQVEVDLGNGYVDLGTQQLMSVPYSIQSQTALTIRNTDLPVYADNDAALVGGLTTGQLYRTSTGDLKIVY